MKERNFLEMLAKYIEWSNRHPWFTPLVVTILTNIIIMLIKINYQ